MKTKLKSITLAVATCFAMLLSAPGYLRAATLTVTSTADSGAGSLRIALNNARDGDTIQFSLPAPSIITLTSGELLVSKKVSILGPGTRYLSISGNSIGRVFHFSPGTTVTMSGLSVINGLATAKYPANMGGGYQPFNIFAVFASKSRITG